MDKFSINLKKINTTTILFFSLVVIFIFLVSLCISTFNFNKTKTPENISRNQEKTQEPITTESSVKGASTEAAKPIVTQTQVFRTALSGNEVKVPVLYYHYIGNNPDPKDTQRDALSVNPEQFAEQMKYLKDNGFTTISYDTLYAALKKQTVLPTKPIILTFDDAYIDFYYNAYNILRQYGLSATVFVPTGLIGNPAYLTWPMIQEMHSSGLVSFEAHSVHHYHLASLAPDVVLQELQQSKKDLQDHLGINVNFMAYPYGETSPSVVSLVQKAGYIGAIGTWSNKIQSEGTIYNSPRLRISGSINIASFASLLQ
ncbi:MAG: polysaccharide deacetylase family protein [Candidatus Daviesbacteria bacterium]|nr:polysaccharide deacetylase family protein [Candidatus Daviesbacteria bacterium]